MSDTDSKSLADKIGNHTRGELQNMIEGMQLASSIFYRLAASTGNHTFIEFNGLMVDYIKVCEFALSQDIDFTKCNKHTGGVLPIQDFQLDYLFEKLECIYGTAMKKNMIRRFKEGS